MLLSHLCGARPVLFCTFLNSLKRAEHWRTKVCWQHSNLAYRTMACKMTVTSQERCSYRQLHENIGLLLRSRRKKIKQTLNTRGYWGSNTVWNRSHHCIIHSSNTTCHLETVYGNGKVSEKGNKTIAKSGWPGKNWQWHLNVQST